MVFKLKLSPDNPNTREIIEPRFAEGGLWEQRGGRAQTRKFAEFFHRHVKVPFEQFSMLDVGCALGDAIFVWKKKYPHAELSGCDVSETAIKRCQVDYGRFGSFFRSSFEEIEGFWDVIYCSNVLEHFEQYIEIASVLLSHCRILYVLTPFGELKGGSPLTPLLGDFHVVTLYRNSFDELIKRGQAKMIDTNLWRCPGAWGFTRYKRVRRIAAFLIKGRNILQEPLQICYTIHNSQNYKLCTVPLSST